MVLIHDSAEIDAGDTYCYEGTPYKEKLEREKGSGLFSILPPDQMEELQALWDEFAKRATPEARLAAALDRLQPLCITINKR